MPTTSRRGFLASSLGAAAIARFAGAAASSELCALTLKQASDGIRSKKVSPVELTEACLDSIKTWNPKINAWITVMREKALAQAKTLAEEQAAGKLRSPLHGIPIGVKDSIDTVGRPHHRRQRGLRVSLPLRRRRGGPPLERRRRGDHRQMQHARVRRGRFVGCELLGAGAQSVESGARFGRPVRRVGRRRRDGQLLRRARHRFGRRHPHAGV